MNDTFFPGASTNPYHDVISTQVGGFELSRIETGNNETLCLRDTIPSIPVYVSAINVYGIILFSVGGGAVLTILILYIDTVWYIMKNSPSNVKTHSAFVLGVYPVVSAATYCAMVVPRAHLLAESVTQGMFMAAMYQLFCLLIAYSGGETEIIRRLKPDSLNTRVGPCCCWPCCSWIPPITLNKTNIKYLRLSVLQLPIVQGGVYMVLLVMWAERESLYRVNYVYVQPVVICSILTGIWGMSVLMRALRDILKEHSIFAKFLVLQMVLFSAKLQGLVTRALVWSGALPCKPPITPTVYGNLIHNTLMMSEMVMLAVIARKLYKQEFLNNNNNIEQVCVISNHVSTIENIMNGAIHCAPSTPTKHK